MDVSSLSQMESATAGARPACSRPLVLAFIALGVFCSLRCLAQQPSPSFDDLAAQAAAARDQQNLPLAIDLYTRVEQIKPDWQEGWWYLTLLQYSSNQFSGTIDAANHLLALVPHAVPAMALRGLSEFETGDYSAALRDLEMAVEHGAASDPHNEQIVRYRLALALAHAGRFQDAFEQYKVFVQKGISDPEMLVALGLAGMRVSSFPNQIAPADREFYQAVGGAGYAFFAGDTRQADTLFQQLFARYPATANLHQFYGLLLFSHDPGLAAQQFQSEVNLAPGNDSARALLAFTLVIAGRYQEALPEARRVYGSAPDMEMAQIAFGRAVGETGETGRGIELLSKVLEQDPDNLEAHMGLAALFARAGKREDAFRERMVCLKLAK